VTVACGESDPVGPDPSLTLAAGSWSAEGAFGAMVFTTSTGGSTDTVDWLARGASLVVDLRTDGTTRGHLFVPGVDEDGGDIDEDLTGTWTFEGSTVRMQHEADTFLRDMTFDYDVDVLMGEQTFSGSTIRVVLRRR
jgi:hypothetical protein